jgi:hypothetical protein
MRVLPPTPHPRQQLLLMFLMIAILTGVRWNLSVGLICISFMARDSEHFFMCFLAIWISSFEKVLLVHLPAFELRVYSGYQSFEYYYYLFIYLFFCGTVLDLRAYTLSHSNGPFL